MALREMKCATPDEANETARDLHGLTYDSGWQITNQSGERPV